MKRQYELNEKLPEIIIPYVKHSESFIRGEWETVLLEAGEDRLYRLFTQDENSPTESPFWFEKSTFDALTNNGLFTNNIVGNARARLAIPEGFSSNINRLSFCDVIKSFNAAFGRANYQLMSKESNVIYIGGLSQLYIPREEWGNLTHFTPLPIF